MKKSEIEKTNKSIDSIEFNNYANQYEDLHSENIKITGELPDYFSEYKVKDLSIFLEKENYFYENILDFGSGIGNSLPYFKKYMPSAFITCSDVSAKSLDLCKERFLDHDRYVLINKDIPIKSSSQDLVFSACVFHHIPENEQIYWLKELKRITKKQGTLFIYEHNPYNPLTVHAFNTCPLDINARMIYSKNFIALCKKAGWSNIKIEYKVFFPAFLKLLRPLEKYLYWLPLGAQYRLTASNI